MANEDLVVPTITQHLLPWGRERRENVEGILIHAMGQIIVVGDDQYSAWDFLNRSPELTGGALSAHSLAEPDGTLVQCVTVDRQALHAGHSRLGVLENLNETFLSIEVLLPGKWAYEEFKKEMLRGTVGYTDMQYITTAYQCAVWMNDFDIPRYRVVGHQRVSGDNVRGKGKGKRDPGVGFNQGRLTIDITRWREKLAA